MAIVSISRIQHRRGLQQDLPNLAAAELGWSLDEQRLFIGNGPLAEGAPRLGNTEILTEHSDILRLAETYTFSNEDAGYVPVTGGKVNRFNSIAYGTASIYNTLTEEYDLVDIYVAVGVNGAVLTSTDTITWSPIYAGTTATLNHVCYGNDKFVAVGASGTIIYSTDGAVWNPAETSVLLTLTSVVWAGGTIQNFIGTSNTGSIIISPDAVTWTVVSSGVSTGLNNVDYNDGRIIVVGDSGVIRTSSNGITWSSPSYVPMLKTESSSTYYNLRSVKWDEDQWIIGGDYSTVLVSVDGLNWTYGYTDTFRAAVNRSTVWVFVGDGGVIYRTVTTDLNQITSPTSENLYDVIYSTTDSIYVAVGANGTILTGNSLGTAWTVQTSGTSEDLNKVYYDSTASRYIAVGTTGTILTSTNATTWTSQTSGTTENLFGIAQWGAGGNYIVSGCFGTILTSTNSTAWTTRNTGITNDLESVTVADLGGGTYRAVAVGVAGTVITSTDIGVTWAIQNSHVSSDLHGVNFITWTYNSITSSKFFAVGNNATIITSDDGFAWTTIDLAGTAVNHMFNAYYGNGIFWTVGSVGYATMYGQDLTDQATLVAQFLTVIKSSATGYGGPALYGSAYGAGEYVIVGQYDTTMASADGQNFVSQTQRTYSVESLTGADIYDCLFVNDQFTAVGNKGLILDSVDAMEWNGTSYVYGNSKTIRTLQRKLDDFVSVKDFGAKGDGITDDTEAINRAMYELYCRSTNPAARKVLHFPGGRYIISDGLNVPTNAVLQGEGANNTIIQQTADPTYVSYVMITADSKQQIQSQIGLNGATLPGDITVLDMGLESAADGVWLVNASRFTLNRVRMTGGTDAPTDSGSLWTGIYIIGSSMSTPTDINVLDCVIEKYNYGVYQDDTEYSRNVIFNSTTFQNLYKGLRLTVNDGMVNTMTISNCVFDLIFAQGIETSYATNITSTFNSYRDVANGSGVAAYPVIEFGESSIGCSSINDQFDRTVTDTLQNPWVSGNSNTGAWFGGHEFRVGLFAQQGGETHTLSPAQSNAATGLTYRLDDDSYNQRIQYMIVRGNYTRSGILLLTYNATALTYNIDDESSETGDVGVVFSLSSDGTEVSLDYTSTSGGSDFTLAIAERYVKTVW